MLSFKKFVAEDKKAHDTWVNQYTDEDGKRIQKAETYLTRRSLRPGSKWEHAGTEYGQTDGPFQERTVNLVVRHKDHGTERKIYVKPKLAKQSYKRK